MRKKYKFIVLLIPRANVLKRDDAFKANDYFHRVMFKDWGFTPFRSSQEGAYLIKHFTLLKKRTFGTKLRKVFRPNYKTRFVFMDKAEPELLTKIMVHTICKR